MFRWLGLRAGRATVAEWLCLEARLASVLGALEKALLGSPSGLRTPEPFHLIFIFPFYLNLQSTSQPRQPKLPSVDLNIGSGAGFAARLPGKEIEVFLGASTCATPASQ